TTAEPGSWSTTRTRRSRRSTGSGRSTARSAGARSRSASRPSAWQRTTSSSMRAPRRRPRGGTLRRQPMSEPRELVFVDDQYYVHATSSRVDAQKRVLKHDEIFAVFDRFGDIHPFGHGEHGVY